MIVLSYLLIFIGCVALSLSMKRHFKQCYPQRRMPSLKKLFIFRIIGFTCLLLSTSIFIVEQGWGIGLVLWFGLLTLVAFLQSLLLTYKPQWIMSIGFIGLVGAVSYTNISL
ncbi:MAG: DUF3325 domain-containing protein [Colwellia sp.]|nr:DUF3325 domain-containing protein [Colwellia sp.]